MVAVGGLAAKKGGQSTEAIHSEAEHRRSIESGICKLGKMAAKDGGTGARR